VVLKLAAVKSVDFQYGSMRIGLKTGAAIEASDK